MEGTATMVEKNEFDNKRDAILYSAFRIFTEKGYHQAKVSEIAEFAHVGKGTVYEYFESKEALLRGVIEAGTKYYIDQLNESAKNADNPLAKLKNILLRNVEILNENENFRQMIYHNFGVMTEQFHLFLHEQRQLFLQRLQKILQEAIEGQHIKPIDVEIGARMVLGSIAAMDPNMGSLSKAQTEAMIDILFKGLQQNC